MKLLQFLRNIRVKIGPSRSSISGASPRASAAKKYELKTDRAEFLHLPQLIDDSINRAIALNCCQSRNRAELLSKTKRQVLDRTTWPIALSWPSSEEAKTMREDEISDTRPPGSEYPDQPDPALTWWHELIGPHRDWWRDWVGRSIEADRGMGQRWDDDDDIARAAYQSHLAGFYPPG